ncbi:MAG: glycerophosphodiester phosphodiesterase [Chitinophagales bacterium]|nr:glycerophosphodiester phosphodiesterase [Chitinophagales bacterium]
MHLRFRFLFMPFAALFSLFSCEPSTDKPVAPPPGFDWQGHRGARGLAPENSIPAFLKALEFQEVTTLELDLAVSKDSQLIVSHEPWFNALICKLPNGDTIPATQAESLLLYQLTAEEIRAYDCGSRPHPRFPEQQLQSTHKPTLSEVCDFVRGKYPERFDQIRWNIEIKSQPAWDGLRHPPVAEFARLVVAELNRLGIRERSTVQSFDPRAVEAMHQLDPGITLAFLVENEEGLDANLKKLSFTPAIYSPYYKLLDKKVVRKCHELGMKVVPWTVNEVPAMRRLIHLGVDGIITDYPNLIAQVSR